MIPTSLMTLAIAPNTVMLIFDLVQLGFALAFGACVGSLTNVLVYRLPRGLDVVVPTSRCPNCGTKLTWRENVPVLGWLMLRGRCRFCGSRISSEYPIVEASMALLFGVLFVCWFLIPPGYHIAGLNLGSVRPRWSYGGFREGWPMYVLTVTMITCVFAMALTDIKTCTVPLVLAWVATGVGLVFHPLHGLLVQVGRGRLGYSGRGWVWTIPTPDPTDWQLIGLALGGLAGVVVANVLLGTGLIGRSFADYESWEKQALADAAAKTPDQGPEASDAPASGEPGGHPTDLWVQYPHARREMLKELVFLAPIIGLAMVGGWLAVKLGGSDMVPAGLAAIGPAVKAAPLWLVAFSGAALGYLVGGGVVWGFRILGSLGFGKEAVGLGDVHLMAAVGACLGWIDATLAFFLSAFVGLAWVAAGMLVSGKKRRAMAFVPSLAIATMLVILGKPLIEIGLTQLLGRPVDLP